MRLSSTSAFCREMILRECSESTTPELWPPARASTSKILCGYSTMRRAGHRWTAAGGVTALLPPTGYTNVAPAARAISSDGSISAGTLLDVDQQSFFVITEQAYRWTSGTGLVGLGYLPGQDDSTTIGMSSDGT